MLNVLKVSLQTTIYNLAERGWSQRRIASELGINRETVSRYSRLAKPAISIAGSEEADRKPAVQSPRLWGSGIENRPFRSPANELRRHGQNQPFRFTALRLTVRFFGDKMLRLQVPINRYSVLSASLKRRSRDKGFTHGS